MINNANKNIQVAILLVSVLVLSLFTACEKTPEEVAVSSVSLNRAAAEMIIGETVQLSATVLPSSATEKSVSWSSSKQSVATVSGSGLVTAIAEGSSTITASCNGKSASCQVTVSKAFIAVTSVTLNKTELALEKGQSETLVATVMPEDATDKTVVWSSSNEAVSSIDQNGKVTCFEVGTAIITAKAGDKTATCNIEVAEKEATTLSVGAVPYDSPLIHFEGGADVVKVEGPSNWTVTVTEGETWCTASRDGDQIQIQTQANGTGSGRKALVHVSTKLQSKDLEVYQVPQIRSIVPDKKRRIRLSQKVTFNDRSMSLVWITLPYVESCEYQTIENLVIGEGGKVAVSPDGLLKYISFEFRPSQRTGTVTGSIEYTATTNYVSVDFSKVDRYFEYDTSTTEYKRFTGINEIDGRRYLDPENPTLSAVADRFWSEVNGDIVEYCRKCYDYVATAFQYQYGGNGIIEDILANGGGDCGNISNLFISMVRHKGIPARPVVMTQPHNENHVRTEFYLAGYGWIPVDPTYHMSGSDEFGKYTDNWVVSNRDEVFDWGIDGMKWKISILQGCNWWWWCWSDGGEVTGKYDLSIVTTSGSSLSDYQNGNGQSW